jgi:hypothetical protein
MSDNVKKVRKFSCVEQDIAELRCTFYTQIFLEGGGVLMVLDINRWQRKRRNC